MIIKIPLRGVAVAALFALSGITVGTVMATSANATEGPDHNQSICHPVEGNGELGNGWDLIPPDKASSHIDEALYPDGEYWKHETKDGRHDIFATEGDECPGTTPPSTTTTSSTSPATTTTSGTSTSSTTSSSSTTSTSETSSPSTTDEPTETSSTSTTTQPTETVPAKPEELTYKTYDRSDDNCGLIDHKVYYVVTTRVYKQHYELVDNVWVLGDPELLDIYTTVVGSETQCTPTSTPGTDEPTTDEPSPTESTTTTTKGGPISPNPDHVTRTYTGTLRPTTEAAAPVVPVVNEATGELAYTGAGDVGRWLVVAGLAILAGAGCYTVLMLTNRERDH